MPDGSFFHRYINDAYRFLPEDDRQFLSEFWTALIQAAGNVEQKLLEANLTRYLGEVLTFSTDRWVRYSFGVASAATAVTTESVTFAGAPVTLANEAMLSFGLLLSHTAHGVQYAYGTDYTVDFLAGTITRVPTGSIPLGEVLTLRYTYVTTSPQVVGYPYAMSIDTDVVSIPILQDAVTVVGATTVLYENVDFVVGDGFLSFAVQPPPHLWAEKTFVNAETPYRRFGVLIDYYLENSPSYVQALRGLYYAYFKGSQLETIENAVRLMLDLPSAYRAGTVVQVIDSALTVQINTITKPYTITTIGDTSEGVLGATHVVPAGVLAATPLTNVPMNAPTLVLTGDVAVTALDTGSAGGAAAGAVPVALGGPVKALTVVTLTIVGTTITVSGDGLDTFLAVGGTLTINGALCTINRATGAINVQKTDAANDAGSNFIGSFTGEINAVTSALGAITGVGIAAGSVDDTTGAFTGLATVYDDTATPGAVTLPGGLLASYITFADLLTELRGKGVVRVLGIGGYSGPLRVRSVSGNSIVLFENALDDYDSAAPPAGVDPLTVQLYVPRQVGYLGDDNVLRYEEVYPDLTVLVAAGDVVERYQPFTDGTQVIDKLVNPNFVFDEVGRAGIQRFLTDAATIGPGPTTDESIAMDTLRSHLWVMQIHGAVFNSVIGLSDVVTFLERIKPQYTEYIFQIIEHFIEAAAINEQEEKELEVDLTYTVNSNVPNVEVFAIQMQLVSFIQATRILTVSAPHDLTVFGAVGETVVITGLDAVDDGEYLIDAVLGATTMRLNVAPASNWAAPPAASRVYVMGTDDEYTAAGAYPYLGVGAGHPYVNEMAEVVAAFEAELHEVRVLGGPTYFIDSNPANPTHFTLWDLNVGVDAVTTAGAANGGNNGTFTVLAVVSDATLEVAGGGPPMVIEGAGIGGTAKTVKTLTI